MAGGKAERDSPGFFAWRLADESRRESVGGPGSGAFQHIDFESSANVCGAPEAECRITTQSAAIASSVLAVSIKVSPLEMLLNATKSAADMGKQLRIGTLLRGEAANSGDRLHLRLQLIDAASDRELWAQDYAADPAGGEIAADVAAALQMRIHAGQKRQIARRRTDDARAYKSYLKAQYFVSKQDKASVWNARDGFQEAIDLDPTFAEAWAGLANSYLLLGSYSWMSPREAGSRARAAADKALSLNEDLAEVHVAMASILEQYDWDRDGAGQHFRRAIESSPSYATARQWYSEHLWSMRRFEQAIAEAKKARELDPLALPAQLSVGIALYRRPRRPTGSSYSGSHGRTP